MFISYRHVEPDQSLANHLADAVKRQHQVFIDTQIPLGQEWSHMIDEKLEGADFLTVLVSENAAESPMVVAEIERAHVLNVARKRPGIIPIRLMFDGQLRYPLSAYVNRFQQAVWNGPADTPRITSLVLEALEAQPKRRRPAEQRQRMIARVRADWVQGVLEKSLYATARIELGLKTQPGAVERGIDVLIQRPGEEALPLAPGTRLSAVFDDQLGQVLVLGAPGAGKTTLLLELACELLDRAEADDSHPIPAVFNLSSWPQRAISFSDWLVEELRRRSDVPRALAKDWVEKEQIIPLLDGLDEAAEDRRKAAVEAINAYRAEHGWVQIAICSRISEYEALTTKLRLPGAVVVQPLSRKHVEVYLIGAGPRLEGVRRALEADSRLWELLETPLMLSIAALAYKDQSVENIESCEGSLRTRQQVLFSAYVKEMFRRRSKEARFTPEQVRSWLSWLAAWMVSRAQTIFQIEDIRSSWVRVGHVRSLVIAIMTMTVTLMSGSLGYLNAVMVFYNQSILDSLKNTDSLYFSMLMAPIGTVMALLRGRSGAPAESLELRWPGTKTLIVTIIQQGLLGGVLGSVSGAAGCKMSGNEDYLVDGMQMFGIAGAVVFGLAGAINSFIGTRAAGVRRSPNLAISSSLRSSLGFFGGAIFLNILSFLLGEVWFEEVFHRDYLESILLGCEFFAWMGLFLALEKGGYFLLDHFLTRWLLSRENLLPWQLVRFLDTAVERILLRKVGGGYIFVHRSLLEHLANTSSEG